MVYKKRRGQPIQKNIDKPCRCGSGNYCHRHLKYGMPDVYYDVKEDGTPATRIVKGRVYGRIKRFAGPVGKKQAPY